MNITTEATSVTRRLAEFIATKSLDDAPTELRSKAARIVIDTVASIVSGAGSEIAQGLLQYARATPGNVPVLGTDVSTNAEMAALVNGAFGHALEYDDVFSMLPGHPAAVMVAAMLGEVTVRPVTSRELVDAFIIGYESCARIAIAMTLEHHRVRGFHATATLGIFAAAAALARLRKLDVDATTRVLSVVASFSSGLLAQIGTSMKSVHSGWAARNAVAAVDLVAVGIEGAANVLESPKGYFNGYGTSASKVERVMDGIAAPWVILSPGVSLKKYPCCFAAHRGIDAILKLKDQYKVGYDDVEHIECRLPPKGMMNMVYHKPRTGLQAKFSMEYCFLATLLDGPPQLSAFTDSAVLRPIMQANFTRVSNIEDPACEEGRGEAGGEVSGARGHVQITLITKDGRRLVQRVAHAPGTPARELSNDELHQKIDICARHAGMTSDEALQLQDTLRAWQCADQRVLSTASLWRPGIDETIAA